MQHHTQHEVYPAPRPTFIRRRIGFLSIAILSIAGVVITIIVCASALAFRGLGIVDHKADALTSMATDLVKALPEYRKSLPPALADAIDDERDPGYLDELKINARMVETDSHGDTRGVVSVTNNGDKIVSLLSLRVVGLDKANDPVWEHSTWGATPIQLEHDWRGPLLPGVTRRIPLRMWRRDHVSSLTCEVTDVRVWKGNPDNATSEPAALTAAQN